MSRMLTLTSGKGQSSLEAAMLFTFMLMALTLFLLVMGNQYNDANTKKIKDKLVDVSSQIDNELRLGAGAQDGYDRTFQIPYNVNGYQFYVQFYDSTALGTPGKPINYTQVVVGFENSSRKFETFIFLPSNIVGNISHGSIRVVKRDQILYMQNSSS